MIKGCLVYVKCLLLISALILLNCTEPLNYGDNDGSNDRLLSLLRSSGWLVDEDASTVPTDIYPFDGDVSSLPASFSLESFYPPVGDQNPLGTCVAWAVGYNLKTALNAQDSGWSVANLRLAANQTSPADLWMGIPAGRKNRKCDGTYFQDAFDVMLSKGAGSMAAVPYDNNGGFCDRTSNGNPGNVIAAYRHIADRNGSSVIGMNVNNFKGYLSMGRPVVFGGTVGKNFQEWTGGGVFNREDYSDRRYVGGHAMTLMGYDDRMGPNGAFRVRNSWGVEWGDGGDYWVDYNFFVNELCNMAFVAYNRMPEEGGGDNASRYDLLAAHASDTRNPETSDPRDRVFEYDVYNNGSAPVTASQRWSVLYMYYSAYDVAGDFGIIFEDYFTDEFGGPGEYGNYDESVAIADAYWNNFDLMPGKKAGEEEFPDGFEVSYTMPAITGSYYLAVFADGYQSVTESDEDNNCYIITGAGGSPLEFVNGVMTSTAAAPPVSAESLGKKRGTFAPAKSVKALGQLNAYTPNEVKTMISRAKRDGSMAKKRAEFRASGWINDGRAVKQSKSGK